MLKNIKASGGFFRICAFAVMFSVILSVCCTYTVKAGSSSAATVTTSEPGYGIVNLDSGTLNVRSGPSTAYSIVGSLTNKSYVMIVGQLDDFYRVMYDTAGNYGYVSKDYVTFQSRDYYLQVVGVASSSSLNIRSNAISSSSIIGSVPAGAYLAYSWKTENGEWYNVVYGNVHGYVSSDYIEEHEF